jgi:hypothetical protein
LNAARLRLEVFQALWAMQQRRPGVPERPAEQSFAMIADAGYDGVGIDLGVTPLRKPARSRRSSHATISAVSSPPSSRPWTG